MSCSWNEPVWTRGEMERFWTIFKPQLRLLLDGALPLPDPCAQLLCSPKHVTLDDRSKRYYAAKMQTNLWNGQYSKAVADLKALGSAFRESDHDELDTLKEIYLLPYRQERCVLAHAVNRHHHQYGVFPGVQ
eukprot:m.6514 g.6514  ORF g.6514 m.6514 type:complete len:132 (+) comp16077_c0_seq2:3194-3589(+)